MIKSRIAFVVQRYGLEINGGAEQHCRQLAEKLVPYYNIDVLTTCALDYITWKNEYSPGIDIINGVNVIRFPVDKERNSEEFGKLSGELFGNYEHDYLTELKWQQLQGPYCTKLLNYLKIHKDEYNSIIFMTYLYFTTYYGLHIAPERSVLIPTAHDEPPIYLTIFNSLFHLPKAVIYNTDEERRFVEKRFDNQHIPSIIAGVGVDGPEDLQLPDFKEKYDISSKYILYVGRIDESKGCAELFDYFIKYKSNHMDEIKLILLGKAVMPIPKHKDIISLGFVSDEDKFAAIKEAELIVIPSPYESLSMILLEAFNCKKPVLVNGKCAVLEAHCVKSNGGLYYKDYGEFTECMKLMLGNQKLRELMGRNGQKYFFDNYRWETVIEKIRTTIETVSFR